MNFLTQNTTSFTYLRLPEGKLKQACNVDQYLGIYPAAAQWSGNEGKPGDVKSAGVRGKASIMYPKGGEKTHHSVNQTTRSLLK